jgi:hypothetical protein
MEKWEDASILFTFEDSFESVGSCCVVFGSFFFSEELQISFAEFLQSCSDLTYHLIGIISIAFSSCKGRSMILMGIRGNIVL